MMLKEVTAVASAALPMAAFRDHLQLGSGFSDLGAEDAALEAYLRAAIAAIEGRIAKALLTRDFVLTLSDWRDGMSQPLPIAPVGVLHSVQMVDTTGAIAEVSAACRLVPDMGRPRLEAVSGTLPPIPRGGRADIRFAAGFGAAWNDLPADLAQAVMLLAAQYFERRHDAGAGQDAMPFGVASLIERWRTVRVLGGRA
ncbi:hypothetical protein LZA78_01105 [Sinirhodobacter sp. WL0062]|uniref:Phage gp6-like head-tail connector protein n=1 Tax=Rhodobacter flavimaris TaxID=2907145 RepID=A0ABS8YQX9_9RHOB|nr:hypothetical protein [Sinirhodobacter sp. WL0062]MCE5972088.1 hypothetical protein [Sinirhodobacter sp. WL0062]